MKRIAILAWVLVSLGFTSQGNVDRWRLQLEALDPTKPLGYFELAEEIIDASPDDRASLSLARHLFGTAGQLDKPTLGASAALALAAIQSRAEDAMRLRAVALMLDPMRDVGASQAASGLVDAETAFDISEAFGGLRTGRGLRLRKVLRDPQHKARLEPFAEQLGGLDWLEEVSSRVRTRPDFGADEIVAMLRVEVRFLEGAHPRWSSEVLNDGGGRLLEVKRREIEELLGGDPERPFFRNGQWRR